MLVAFNLFFSIFFLGQTTSLHYDVTVKGRNVGYFKATRMVYSDRVEYTSESKTSVNFLASVSVLVKQKASFKNGVLMSSQSITTVNGQQHNKTEVKRSGDRYVVTKDGDQSIINETITFSILQLYYAEPNLNSKLFSEFDGSFHSLVRDNKGQFVKTNPKGDKNFYSYDEAGLKEADLDAGWYRFKMIRSD